MKMDDEEDLVYITTTYIYSKILMMTTDISILLKILKTMSVIIL